MNDLRSLLEIEPPKPGESDEDFCRRLFGGRTYECNRCRVMTHWYGICDKCDEILTQQKLEAESPQTDKGRLVQAGVPSAYAEWTWSGVVKPEGFRIAGIRGWDGQPPIMTICGPTGTGKTGVAVCLARDWVLNGKRVKWLYMPDWLDDLRSDEREGDVRTSMRDVCGFPGLLVLDELVTSRITDYGRDRVLQCIDARTRELLPTVATCNLPPRSAHGRPAISDISERVASRVEGGRAIVWAGTDRRVA